MPECHRKHFGITYKDAAAVDVVTAPNPGGEMIRGIAEDIGVSGVR